MTMTSEEKIMRNLKLTGDIQRAKYDPRKFGCQKVERYEHDYEIDMRTIPWKFKCKHCDEKVEV